MSFELVASRSNKGMPGLNISKRKLKSRLKIRLFEKTLDKLIAELPSSSDSEISETSENPELESRMNPEIDDVTVSKVEIETPILGKYENSGEPEVEKIQKEEDPKPEDTQRLQKFLSQFEKIINEETLSLKMNFQTLSEKGKTAIVNYFYKNPPYYKKIVEDAEEIKKALTLIEKTQIHLEDKEPFEKLKISLRFYEDFIEEFEKRIVMPLRTVQVSKKTVSEILTDSGIYEHLSQENYPQIMNFQLWSEKSKMRMLNDISADPNRHKQFLESTDEWKLRANKLEIEFKNEGPLDPKAKEFLGGLAINVRFYEDVKKELEKIAKTASKKSEGPILEVAKKLDASKFDETLEMIFGSDEVKDPTDDVKVSKVEVETPILGKDENSEVPENSKKNVEVSKEEYPKLPMEDRVRLLSFYSDFDKIFNEETYSLKMNFQTVTKEGRAEIVRYFNAFPSQYKKMVQEAEEIKKKVTAVDRNLLPLEDREPFDKLKVSLRFYEYVIKEFEKRKAKPESEIQNPNEDVEVSTKSVEDIFKDSGLDEFLSRENFREMWNFQLWSKKSKKRIVNFCSDRYELFLSYAEYASLIAEFLGIRLKFKGLPESDEQKGLSGLALKPRFNEELKKELEKKMAKAVSTKSEGPKLDEKKKQDTIDDVDDFSIAKKLDDVLGLTLNV